MNFSYVATIETVKRVSEWLREAANHIDKYIEIRNKQFQTEREIQQIAQLLELPGTATATDIRLEIEKRCQNAKDAETT